MVAYGTTRDAEHNIELCVKDISGEINPNPENRDLLQDALTNVLHTRSFALCSRRKNEFQKFRKNK